MTIETTEIVLPGIVEPEGLQVTRRRLPAPGPGQVRIRMEATGVSFAEQQMRRGKYNDQPPFPFVPGYDLVGIVEEVGPGVDPGLVGGTEFSGIRFKGDTARAASVYAGTTPLTPEDIAEAVFWVTTLPAHVNVNTLELMPVCQTFSALSIARSG